MPVVRVRGSNPWVPRPRPSQKGAGMCSMRPPAAHEVRYRAAAACHPDQYLVSGRRGRKWVRSPPSCQPRWVTGSESSQGAGISDLDPPFAPPDRLHAAPSSSSRACSTMTASWTSATAAAKMAQGAQPHPTYGRGLRRIFPNLFMHLSIKLLIRTLLRRLAPFHPLETLAGGAKSGGSISEEIADLSTLGISSCRAVGGPT